MTVGIVGPAEGIGRDAFRLQHNPGVVDQNIEAAQLLKECKRRVAVGGIGDFQLGSYGASMPSALSVSTAACPRCGSREPTTTVMP